MHATCCFAPLFFGCWKAYQGLCTHRAVQEGMMGEAEAKGDESGCVHDAQDLVKLAVVDAKW